MLHFTVSDSEAVSGCVKCCCENLALKPGTISKVSVGYASWAVPIGQLHCTPQFMLEQMETCPVPTGGNLPPRAVAEVAFYVGVNGHLDGDLTTMVKDPEDEVLKFKLLPLYGPAHGKLVFDPSGVFDYDPVQNYKGEDRFFASASDGVNSFIFEVRIGVEMDPYKVTKTPTVSVVADGVQIDQRYYTVSFPIKVSPAAQLCEVWRLTVMQGALDCDCTCYARNDCFDIKIVKC
jgi:hypothetical protein